MERKNIFFFKLRKKVALRSRPSEMSHISLGEKFPNFCSAFFTRVQQPTQRFGLLLYVRYRFAQTRFISLCNFVHLAALCFHFQMVIGKANLLPFAINHVSSCVSMLEFVSWFSGIPLRKFIL